MEIIVYTGIGCGNCENVKEKLVNANIDFEERNIHTNTTYRMDLMKKGFASIPVIVVDGKVVSDVELYEMIK